MLLKLAGLHMHELVNVCARAIQCLVHRGCKYLIKRTYTLNKAIVFFVFFFRYFMYASVDLNSYSTLYMYIYIMYVRQ